MKACACCSAEIPAYKTYCPTHSNVRYRSARQSDAAPLRRPAPIALFYAEDHHSSTGPLLNVPSARQALLQALNALQKPVATAREAYLRQQRQADEHRAYVQREQEELARQSREARSAREAAREATKLRSYENRVARETARQQEWDADDGSAELLWLKWKGTAYSYLVGSLRASPEDADDVVSRLYDQIRYQQRKVSEFGKGLVKVMARHLYFNLLAIRRQSKTVSFEQLCEETYLQVPDPVDVEAEVFAWEAVREYAQLRLGSQRQNDLAEYTESA